MLNQILVKRKLRLYWSIITQLTLDGSSVYKNLTPNFEFYWFSSWPEVYVSLNQKMSESENSGLGPNEKRSHILSVSPRLNLSWPTEDWNLNYTIPSGR